MQTHDPLVQCPFEKSHMIYKSRLITHLTKCQKNHMGEGKIPCPLNATHFVQEQLMTYHMSFECTDRGDIERLQYQIEAPATTYFPPVEEPILPPAEENWDSSDAPTYNLEQALSERAPVLRSLNVAPNNAAIEQRFSVNKECLVENLHEDSFIAQRVTYDAVTAAGGLLNK
uniref:CHHC U11-48K-type domain-containing protein n=1 Tax=Timema bartmani TaxID=61472 RepID=A0A7R9F7C6_9NEOP|nr:unnamed protein product [Timema bartmani]